MQVNFSIKYIIQKNYNIKCIIKVYKSKEKIDVYKARNSNVDSISDNQII